jgi:hypothetical protein
MAFQFDEGHIYDGQLLVCPENVIPSALGVGPQKIIGSSYIQGPLNVGDTGFSFPPPATVMIGPRVDAGPSGNVTGSICGVPASNLSLFVRGNTAVKANLFVSSDILARGNITAQGEVKSRCGAHILSAKKNFDIPHPTKEGWRLRHTCPEGPSNDVYFRGRISNKDKIYLPKYWEELVDPTTITVNLTPIGAHQNVIVKRIGENVIHLQANGGLPINCFFHVFATRADGERLIPEYEGESPADYPGNNEEYSISGYHYDTKETK